MKRRRGFTLVELLCYLSLLVAGIIVIAGLEFTATRAAFLERALIDIGAEADGLGIRFRDDVREASVIATPFAVTGERATLLILGTASGGEVRWEIERARKLERTKDGLEVENAKLVRKTFARPGTEPQSVEAWANLEKLAIGREDGATRPTLRLEATLVRSRGDEISARRTYRTKASPVVEGHLR